MLSLLVTLVFISVSHSANIAASNASFTVIVIVSSVSVGLGFIVVIYLLYFYGIHSHHISKSYLLCGNVGILSFYQC